MKKSIALIALILSSGATFSQSTYEIKTAGQNYTLAQVQTAIESANFCGYYYSDERHLLLFDDGTEVELKSNDELLIEGVTLGNTCVTADRKENPVVWAIAANGTILRGGTSTNKENRLK
ncbi:MAG: hypothetical protein ACJASQ_004174 [Crocinitomicaceae bacterium]|jgi:hypothetical protein